MLFERLADVVIRRGWIVVLFWVVATAALVQFAPSWESVSRDDDVHFFPAEYPSVIGQDLLDRGFPHDASSSQAVVVAERRDGPLTTPDRDYVAGLVAALNRLREANPKLGIRRVDWYKTPVIGPRLLSPATDAGQAVLTVVSINGTYLAKSTRIAMEGLEKTLQELPKPPTGLNLALTGSAAVGRDMNKASDESVSNTTWATIALVVIILLVVYRSPLLALIPILTIALSVWVSLMAIAVLAKLPGLNFQVINITNLFVIVVLFGAGTDYCLFLIARYREELIRGLGRDEALREAISKVGGALVASAGTVIVGLGMLWFSSFAKIQYTGPAIALSLAIGLLAALTLAPVLLALAPRGGLLAVPAAAPRTGADFEAESLEQLPMSGFWAGVADLVVRRPGVIMAICVLALTPLAVIGARTKANYSQLADLNPDYVEHRRRAHDPAAFPRRRAGHDERPDRPPPPRLPLRRGTRGARSAQPAAGGHPQRRRGPLGLAAAGRARVARREPEHARSVAEADPPPGQRQPLHQRLRPEGGRPQPRHADRPGLQDRPVLRPEPAGARRQSPGRQGGERAGRAPRRGLGLGGHRVLRAGQ